MGAATGAMTASLEELKQALVETLETRGVLGKVKAQVRAEIFSALDDEDAQRPELPKANVIINELIREYLEYNQYHHTLSVLLPESGHPEERCFDRRFLASELRVQEDDRSRGLPLLYALIGGCRQGGSEVIATSSPPLLPVAATTAAPSNMAAASSVRVVPTVVGNAVTRLPDRGGSVSVGAAGTGADGPVLVIHGTGER